MFDNAKEAYPEQSLRGGAIGPMRPRTKLERLHDLRKNLEAKLEEVNTAINLLEGNPQLTEIIDALEKVSV